MIDNPSSELSIHRFDQKNMPKNMAEELFEVADAGFKGASPWSVSHIQDTLETQNALVFYASIAQKTVGFIVASETIDLLDIYIVVVAEDYKRQAIGTKLFEQLIRYGQEYGIDAVVLETRKTNLPAIGLYERVGFQKVGVRKAYYSSPIEDAIVMKKELRKENNDC